MTQAKKKSVQQMLNKHVNLQINNSGLLSDTPYILLIGEDDNPITSFPIQQNGEDDNTYNIYNDYDSNRIIGALHQSDGDKITGKINLSDISDFQTCVVCQLSRYKTRMLLKPQTNVDRDIHNKRESQFILNNEIQSVESK